uniref:Uncharacterized protein LOC111114349 n=1 Tax=Crassostrea virginica TaxID=6565 RepID=A0A8B8BY77_CRAVI|nr:uncharacterized protein LOC111114349 [Crassostrea virginica]
MAGYISRLSPDDIPYLKLDTVIQKVAIPTVLKVFNASIPPNDLANVLNSNAGIIQELWKKRVINADQLDILVRVPGVQFTFQSKVPHQTDTSSEDFDISLMICILRSLNMVQAPSKGWDTFPPKEDTTMGANLYRIKALRNRLAHLPKTKIKNKNYKHMSTLLRKALSEISNGESDSIVSYIESFDFGTSDKDELIRNIQQQIREVQEDLQFHRNLKENTSSVLKVWNQEMKNVYRTRGTLEVFNKIRTNSVVMIIGNSGSGKTTAMKHASLQLQKEGYEIVLISSPYDILSHRFVDRKQLFIIDDVVGKYRVDTMAFDMWKRLQERISVVFKHSGAKLLVTLRRQLYQTISHISSSTFFESKVVDLDSKDLALSGDEKMGMLEYYLDNRKLSNLISMDEKVKICTCDIAFPLLCHMFSSSQDFFKQNANFFLSPYEPMSRRSGDASE